MSAIPSSMDSFFMIFYDFTDFRLITPICKGDYTDTDDFKITLINVILKSNRWNRKIISGILFKTTVGQMIIHHTNGLHVGVGDRRAEKCKAPFLHVLTNGIRYGRTCRYVVSVVDDRLMIGHKAVHVFIER